MFYATEVLGQCGQMDTGHRKQPKIEDKGSTLFWGGRPIYATLKSSELTGHF